MLTRIAGNPLGARLYAHTVEAYDHARIILDLAGPAREETVFTAETTRDVWTTLAHREPEKDRASGSYEFEFELAVTIERLPIDLRVVDKVT